jgi:hypothetical protein
LAAVKRPPQTFGDLSVNLWNKPDTKETEVNKKEPTVNISQKERNKPKKGEKG